MLPRLRAIVQATTQRFAYDGLDLIAEYDGSNALQRDRAPRLIELVWGNAKHPRIAIVGKGVCFDSGGLDIKSASGIRLMKKDVGGAARWPWQNLTARSSDWLSCLEDQPNATNACSD